jgi:hypothetical protein
VMSRARAAGSARGPGPSIRIDVCTSYPPVGCLASVVTERQLRRVRRGAEVG